MYCPQCGVELPSNERFCSKCGAAIAKSRPSKKFWIILFVVIVLVLIVGGGGVVWYMISTRMGGPVRINPKDGAVMVYVPAGEFLMGSKEGEGALDEQPQHIVFLSGYWIYYTEVTVAQYRQFCKAMSREMPYPPSWGWQDNDPIVFVPWEYANAYAQWAGVALPTEAQWEKAARGTDGRICPWGNYWNWDNCVNGLNSRVGAKPVGSVPVDVSPFGALDMAGNVCEWCADWYGVDYYKNSPIRDPAGSATGDKRVSRGGSWLDADENAFCCAHRSGLTPIYGYNYVGFRCVLRSPE